MNKIEENIKYTKEKWTKYLRYLGPFLYTERIHYYHFYKFLKNKYNEKLHRNTILLDIGFGSGFNIYKISKKYSKFYKMGQKNGSFVEQKREIEFKINSQ